MRARTARDQSRRTQFPEFGENQMGGGAMQTNSNKLTIPARSFAAGTWVALVSLLALCLSAPVANASPNPPTRIVATGPVVQVGIMKFTPPGGSSTGGGWDAGASPVGGTFVVGANGNAILGDGYGTGIFEITPSGTQTILATLGNSSAAAIDGYGNVYVSTEYNGNIYKLPYNPVTGTYTGFTTAPTANCAGGTQDTTACVFAPNVQATPGIAGMAFDGQGNFIFAADTNAPISKKYPIYVCNAACQAETDGNGTSAPVLLYSDSNALGAIAADPWGNVFFSDGASGSSGAVSNLNEIALTGGVYGTPTVVESYTNKDGYTNGICGVTVGADGTVYFGTNTDGIFGIPNSSAGLNLSGIYVVSNATGSKAIAVDPHGNFFFIPYNNTLGEDVISILPTGSFQLGATAVGGTATTATATIIDSSSACTATLTNAATQFGAASTEFTAAVTSGSGCGAALGTGNGTFSPAVSITGSVISETISFVPSSVGVRNATLTITDSAGDAKGVIALSGIGQGGFGNFDPGTETVISGLTSPASVVTDPAGDVISADASGQVYEIAHGSTTLNSIGSGFTSPSALAFDANGNLFIADKGIPAVFEIVNTGTGSAFVAGTQSTLIGATMPIGGGTLKDPVGLAVGPDGTLYIADSSKARVVAFNPLTGFGGLTGATAASGLSGPTGVAVDSSNNLYVADPVAGGVFMFTPAGVVSAISAPGVTEPSGVGVDASGSVVVADMASGKVVRIPNMSGTLNTSKAITIETVPSTVTSMNMDSWGNLSIADDSTQYAYSINRSMASINLGTATDGAAPATGIVYLENEGNESVTLATPAVTQPTNTFFTLTAASSNGCDDGSSGPAGASCEFTAAFAPTGSANQAETGTASVASNAGNSPSTVTMSGTATTSSLAPQTISFTVQATGYVGQVIALSATASSGLPVTFTSGTPTLCTVSGTSATFIAAGTCKINANQAGSANYQAAPQVIGSVAVTTVTPTGVPSLLSTQVTWLNPTGSFTDGQNPQGGSFALTQNGEIVVGTTYNNKVYFVNASTGATISTVSFNGPGGMAVDSNNNLYLSHLYNSVVYKVPYVNGAYATLTDSPTPAPPACTGSDTAECTFATSGQNTKAIAFDASGNFYMVSEPASSGAGASGIYECGSGCLPAGTGTEIYADADGVSQIAFDPWGNLFFTDANYLESGASNESNSGASSSALKELVYTSGTGFAATPTVLQTFTNAGTPGGYDDMLASVAVSPVTGTVYYGILYDGTYAIPNTQAGGPVAADSYAVSSQGAKAFTADSLGNLYMVANTSGSDTVGVLLINDLTAPTAQFDGPAVTGTATLADNAVGCGKAATPVFTSSNPEFSASAGTTCSSIGVSSGNGTLLNAISSASSYVETISFAATSGGTQTATLTVTDTTNGGEGTSTVSGFGQETPQTVTIVSPTQSSFTYASGLTISLIATAGASGNPVTFAIDSSSTGTGTISAVTKSGNNYSATLTVTMGGTITIDANEVGGLSGGKYYEADTVQIPLTINGALQTIAFAAPATPIVYAPAETITLTGASSSGLTVSYSLDAASSSGVATISGNVVTVTGTGSIVIDANQAGNADYAAAATVSHTVTVTLAPQVIVPGATTPPAPIYWLAGIQITVTATGGASGNPVLFTLDSASQVQGTISATTLANGVSSAIVAVTSTNPSSSTGSNLVIDANQGGNTDYSDAPQVKVTITLLPALPTQTITFPDPGTQVLGTVAKPTTVTLQATASSGLPVSYATTTTSVCTVSGNVATMLAAGTCTITATQAGDNKNYAAAAPVSVSFTVNVNGDIPGFSLSLTLPSMTIEPGSVGLTSLTVTSTNNFTGSVSFACSGLPSGYICTFNPNPIVVPEGAASTTALSISPSSTTTAMNHKSGPLFPAATLAIALCFLGFRKRGRLQLLVLLVASAAGFALLSGCGSSSSTTTTKAATSTVTVTATSGTVQQTTTFSVKVE
jgi:hypothetical protein